MITIEPYEIGRMYKVPTVVDVDFHGKSTVWPVIGAAHEDKKIIGFPHVHYHYDARFMTDRQLNMISNQYHAPEVAVFSLVMYFKDSEDVQPIVMAWRKCRRAYNQYPDSRAKWLPALESEYQDAKIDGRLICPHRGASLAGLQPVNGCVTCPLHGLRWDCKTGELRKREKND